MVPYMSTWASLHEDNSDTDQPAMHVQSDQVDFYSLSDGTMQSSLESIFTFWKPITKAWLII